MSDQVEVAFGDNPQETATLLLAAAEDAGLDPAVAVRTSGDATFVVPAEVADAAGVDVVSDGEESEEAPAKKAPAKKTAAKKS